MKFSLDISESEATKLLIDKINESEKAIVSGIVDSIHRFSQSVKSWSLNKYFLYNKYKQSIIQLILDSKFKARKKKLINWGFFLLHRFIICWKNIYSIFLGYYY